MRSLFINRDERLRSGWKVFLVIAMYCILAIISEVIVAVSIALKGGDLRSIGMSNYYINNLLYGVRLIIVLFVVHIGMKHFEKEQVKNIGLISMKDGGRDLIYGLLGGAISMALIFGILLTLGKIALINPLYQPQFPSSVLWGIPMFIFVGLGEEILTRGYIMYSIGRYNRVWVAVISSALLFAVMHLLNPNMKMLGFINIFIVGILFSYMVIKTGNLWMAIGYHITWNYFQGNIFSFPVSGQNQEGMYMIQVLEDSIFTGGAFGPEAGIVATIVLGLGFLAVWRYKR